jgi:hypothetical protein
VIYGDGWKDNFAPNVHFGHASVSSSQL